MIRLIAGIDRQRGIAKKGNQPWNIPADLADLRQKTLQYGGQVLMGQRTYDTIGHPLADRQTFVLSHDTKDIPGITFVNNLDEFLAGLNGDLWVFGGASVFEQTIGRADELYLTEIEADFGCDQFFPEYHDKFEIAERSNLHEQNGFIYTFNRYIPKSSH
ncbi:MAG TPA: dihydrofolate reductase [Candidatus Saccharimonadales bacterium]|nr:dihydrofolate reductase [Candidatus Saccharimonadales bacterium]